MSARDRLIEIAPGMLLGDVGDLIRIDLLVGTGSVHSRAAMRAMNSFSIDWIQFPIAQNL